MVYVFKCSVVENIAFMYGFLIGSYCSNFKYGFCILMFSYISIFFIINLSALNINKITEQQEIITDIELRKDQSENIYITPKKTYYCESFDKFQTL